MINRITKWFLKLIAESEDIEVEVNSNNGKRWSEQDISFLMSNPMLSDEELSISLSRSIDAIKWKKDKLRKDGL